MNIAFVGEMDDILSAFLELLPSSMGAQINSPSRQRPSILLPDGKFLV